MRLHRLLASFAILLASSAPLAAQSPSPQPRLHVALYTVLGAIGGFAVGAWVSYKVNVFEDTENGEGKALTTVLVSTAGGAIVGHLLAPKDRTSPIRTVSHAGPVLTDEEIVQLARTIGAGRPASHMLEGYEFVLSCGHTVALAPRN